MVSFMGLEALQLGCFRKPGSKGRRKVAEIEMIPTHIYFFIYVYLYYLCYFCGPSTFLLSSRMDTASCSTPSQ